MPCRKAKSVLIIVLIPGLPKQTNKFAVTKTDTNNQR